MSESPHVDLAGVEQMAEQLAEQIAGNRQVLASLIAAIELLKGDHAPPAPRPGPKRKTLRVPAGMFRSQLVAVPAVSSEPNPPVQDRATDNMQGLEVDFTGCRNMLERLRRIGRACEGHYLSLGLVTHYLAPRGAGQGKAQEPAYLH